MPLRILIVHSDESSASSLVKALTLRGDQPYVARDAAQALAQLDSVNPQVAFVDLHLPGNTSVELLRTLHKQRPDTKIIVTNQRPDFQGEMLAKEQGVSVFLRPPFTTKWVDAALKRLSGEPQPEKEKPVDSQPRVRVPVRLKITLPYMLLALAFALAGAYIVSNFILNSIQDRFNNQLVGTGKQSADWMVQEETRRLQTLRVIANTQGVADALKNQDAESLRQLLLPHFVNSNEEAFEVLDTNGVSVLSLRRASGVTNGEYTDTRGENIYPQWDFVKYVLDRRQDNGQDKNAGLVRASWGDYFYVDGPVLAQDGTMVGVVMVGRSLNTLVREMHQDILGEITLYSMDGNPAATTMATGLEGISALPAQQAANLFVQQDQTSLFRDLTVASNEYREILGPWEARGGADLGVLGTSMPRAFLTTTNKVTSTQVFLLVAVGLLLVVTVGITLANQITRPLLKVVKASSEVARGNLEVKVDTRGDDEVAVLAHSFNAMVIGLQEGSIYRDLLGRTVSPEIREQLRQTFTSGNLRLEGQEAIATVMLSNIRGFSSLSEKADPATVFHWLNEYFSEIVPMITANNGVVNKFDGDAMLAFFGILPKLISPKQSAYSACQTAMQVLSAIERLNLLRVERGEPPLSTGIGINTGMVTAGGLGTSDRMHYTIIGDTVNTAQRLEGITRQLFNVSGVVISQSTYVALGENRDCFRLEPLGPYMVKGKAEQLQVYRLLPLPEGMPVNLEAVI
ncbi:MAG: cache domain-containing protein [Anaerolineales bacterium]